MFCSKRNHRSSMLRRTKRSRTALRRALQLEPLEARRLLATWSGDIPNGTVWSNTEVQRIVGAVRVPTGATLTIEPGTIIKANEFAGINIIVEGTLLAIGTAAFPIVFTSYRDDTGLDGILNTSDDQDTNANGPTNGNHGDWNRIEFKPGSAGNLLDNVRVRFGGANSSGSVVVDNAGLAMSNSSVQNSYSSGVRIQTSNPTLTSNTFENNFTAAISMDLASNPAIIGVTATNNAANALILDSGALTGNGFWDDSDIVYRLTGDVTVPLGSTLTVGTGQVVKFRTFAGDELFVDGTLIADGTTSQPIVFTSDRDDSAGGDTNNNGSTSGNHGDWEAIHLLTGSANHVLDNVQIKFGGSGELAALVASVPMTLTNSLVRNSYTSGVRIQNSNPTLTSNTFENNFTAAISMDLASNPAIIGVTVTNNGSNALILDNGTLTGNGFWDDQDIVYRLTGDVTVPLASTLTVAAGQVVKFRTFAGDEIFVDGKLTADGTAAQQIIFTSDRDDSAGGDTNNNGLTLGNNGDWEAIHLRAGSSEHLLDNVQVRFGGAGEAAALVASVPMTLTNSEIRNSYTSGIRLQTSHSTLTTNTFANSLAAAISMDLASNPSITGVTVTNNGANALILDSGSIVGNGLWNDPDIVYRLTGPVTVPSGNTLTVGVGQIVKFRTFAGDEIFVDGTLIADGTAAQPIIFTSDRDDSAGGDTNNNGLTFGNNGDWEAIHLRAGSAGHLLDNVQIKFGGAGESAALVASVPMTLTNSEIRNSYTSGIRLQTSHSTLSSIAFANSFTAAISMDLASNPSITGVTMTNNGANALILDSGSLVGSGIWDDPDIIYRLTGDVTVPVGNTLTVGAGQIVKFRTFAGDSLSVNGTLIADGTAAQPIIFTSDRDDSAGGDTNNNGLTFGNNGDWEAILFVDGSIGNVLDHIDVRYGGAGNPATIVLNGGAFALTNSVVRHSYSHGVIARTNTTLTSNNNLLVNHFDNGLRLESGSRLTAFNNTIDGNFRGIGVDASTATVTNSLITNHTNSGVFVANGGSFNGAFNDVFNSGVTNYQGTSDQNGVNGNISIDPKYASRVNLLYTLLARAPVIDSGTSTGAPTTDISGNARFDDPGVSNAGSGAITYVDLGAFERQNVSDPINLVVLSTGTSSQQVQIGDALTLNWTIQNNQVVAAEGAWTDAVFASTDSLWDLSDTLVATLEHTGGLAAGASYEGQVTLTTPAKPAGPLYFIVRADSRNVVRESIEIDNESLIAANLTVPQLTVGTPTIGQFTAVGQSRYYQITAAAGNTLLLTLDSAATTGAIELYVRKDGIPTAGLFDARYQSGAQPDQELTIPTTEDGTYYLLVLDVTAPSAGYALNAQLIPFSVRSASPSSVGNGGFATIHIRGARFGAQDTVTLRAPDGSIIPATHSIVSDAANLNVEFDLRGRASGLYDVVVTNGQSSTAIGDDLVQVVAAQQGDPVVQLIGPGALRRNRVVTYTASIRNTSNNDVILPLLFFDSHGSSNLGLSPDSLLSTKLSVVPRASGGAAGILHPGEAWSLTIFAQLLPTANSPVNVTMGSIKSSNTLVDQSFIASLFPLSPETMYADRANEFRAYLNAISGPTNADFVRNIHLGAGELYAASPAGTTLTVEDVWRSEIMVIDYIVNNHLMDPYYLANGITFGSNGSIIVNPPPSGPEQESTEDAVAGDSNSLVGTTITTTKQGNGTGKVRYVSAGFIASQNPYGNSDWVKEMADNLACVYPNDTIKVVNWNSGTGTGFGTHIVTGAVAYGAAGSVAGPFGTLGGFIAGGLTGAAIAGINYYRNRANNTELVGQDIARDILNTTDPGNVVMYGHSLGAHVSGYTGRALNGRLGTIIGFDPAGELFGGAKDGLIPNAAQRTVGIFTSKSFGMLGSHIVYGRDPKTVTQEQYYPQHSRYLVAAHAESFNWYLRKLKSACEAGLINMDPDLDAPTNEDGTSPNDPATGGVTGAITSDTQRGASSAVVQSIDPNDLLHPAGYGPDHWVDRDDPLPYTIQFENDPTHGATAPAQQVTISNTLDADLDWNTFELGTFGFGSTVVPIPAGLRSYSTDVDTQNQDGTPLRVHVDAGLNPATGVFFVDFRSLDPLTGQFPEDALAGFLPVNDSTHRGEGFITYTVYPKSTTPTATPITNKATIVFDDNPFLDTPTRLNTIDVGPPTSNIVVLPALSQSTFNVQWSGDDVGGSGIASFDIYVSIDTAAPTLWLDDTALLQADYTGQAGRTYAFYSIATDGVGHREATPLLNDSSTTVTTHRWQNATNRFDVDKDGFVAPLDVLLVINNLKRFGSRTLTVSEALSPLPPPFVDVDGDDAVAPIDVLQIINFLKRRTPSGEGESSKLDSDNRLASERATDTILSVDASIDEIFANSTLNKKRRFTT